MPFSFLPRMIFPHLTDVTAEALRASCPSAEVLPGRLLNGGSSDGELKKWAESAIG